MIVMRRFFVLVAGMFGALFMVACEDQELFERNGNFDVPELTSENSIVITLHAESGREIDRLHLQGGKIAVDWGDGSPMTKDIHPEEAVNDVGYSRRIEFNHTYTTGGEYTIRIWSQELTGFDLSGYVPGKEANKFDDISFGYCPKLTNISLSDVTGTETLDLNGCTSLQRLGVSECNIIRSIELESCPLEGYVSISRNPMLSSLDLAGKTRLDAILCDDNALEELFVPAGITYLRCSENLLGALDLEGMPNLQSLYCGGNPELSTIILDGCDKLQALDFSNTAVEEFDFGAHPLLEAIYCGGSQISGVDVSGNTSLTRLDCSGLGLSALDITNNPDLTYLNVSDNALTALDVSGQAGFLQLNIADNLWEKESLNIPRSAGRHLHTCASASPTLGYRDPR